MNSSKHSRRNRFSINLDENIEVDVIETDKPNDDEEASKSVMKYVDSNMVTNSSKWSRMDEKTVNKYIMKAIGYKTLYNDTAFVYEIYYNLVKIPLVLLTVISMCIQVIFATLIQNNSVNGKDGIFSITSAAVSATVATLTYLISIFDHRAKADGSRDAANAFSEIADELKTLLSFPRNIRANPYQVITTIQTDFKKLLKTYSKYPIPMSVFYKFAKNNSGIALDIVGNTDADQFDLHDGELEKNVIMDKFIDSIRGIRNSIPNTLVSDVRRRNTVSNEPPTWDPKIFSSKILNNDSHFKNSSGVSLGINPSEVQHDRESAAALKRSTGSPLVCSDNNVKHKRTKYNTPLFRKKTAVTESTPPGLTTSDPIPNTNPPLVSSIVDIIPPPIKSDPNDVVIDI